MQNKKEKINQFKKAYVCGALHFSAGVIKGSSHCFAIRKAVPLIGISAFAAGQFVNIQGGGVGDIVRSVLHVPMYTVLSYLSGVVVGGLLSLPSLIRDVKDLVSYDAARIGEGARSYLLPSIVEKAMFLPSKPYNQLELALDAMEDPALQAYLTEEFDRDVLAYRSMTTTFDKMGLRSARIGAAALMFSLVCAPAYEAVTFSRSTTTVNQKPAAPMSAKHTVSASAAMPQLPRVLKPVA